VYILVVFKCVVNVSSLLLLVVGVSTGNVHSKYASYQITLNEEQRKKVGDGQHKVLLR
jgi:hypothetical protein